MEDDKERHLQPSCSSSVLCVNMLVETTNFAFKPFRIVVFEIDYAKANSVTKQIGKFYLCLNKTVH
ncbi:hypothetical protein Csa_005581 [Cucumis sativus]|nr:hypothetical protein Csa_005581 [Cucumis sativus]